MLKQFNSAFRPLFLIICSLCFCYVHGQDMPGKKDSLRSTILNETRYIQVVLPEKYNPDSSQKYAVIYVLDGEGNTKLFRDLQLFINGEGFMPQTIIVGIFNTDRTRDLTPTREMDFPTSGGADKFLAFLKSELIPYINSKYASNGDNIIFGHSFGGLFVTYALLKEPQIFNSYIAADPSFWWGNRNMEKLARERLPTLSGMSKSIFITGREGEGLREMGILPMDTILQNLAPKELSWKLAAYPDETHGTVRLKSIYDGLKFTFNGYQAGTIAVHPMGGIVIPGNPFNAWCTSDLTGLRFTTDSTEPTILSPALQQVTILSGPGILSIKKFTTQHRFDKSLRIEYKAGEPLPPVQKEKKSKPGGLHYEYYEGVWDKLPDFKKCKPVSSGKADSSFDLNKLPRKDSFGLILNGQVQIKEEGYYVFGLSSDDGSKLFLDGRLLIDNDGLHADDRRSFIVPLKKGFYPLRLEYFQKTGGRDLMLIYITPEMIISSHPNPIPIPFADLFSQ